MLLNFLVISTAFAVGAPLAVVAGDYIAAFLCVAVGFLWVLVTPHDI